jgi:hypothetical protein
MFDLAIFLDKEVMLKNANHNSFMVPSFTLLYIRLWGEQNNKNEEWFSTSNLPNLTIVTVINFLGLEKSQSREDTLSHL